MRKYLPVALALLAVGGLGVAPALAQTAYRSAPRSSQQFYMDAPGAMGSVAPDTPAYEPYPKWRSAHRQPGKPGPVGSELRSRRAGLRTRTTDEAGKTTPAHEKPGFIPGFFVFAGFFRGAFLG